MAKPKLKNVLPNTYVPVLSKKVLVSVLKRLPKSSIVALLQLWPLLKNTQPKLPKENALASHAEYSRQVRDEARAMREPLWKKNRIIDKILFEYWPDGLNLLQLAQIDCQLIVDNSNAYLWVLSTARDAWGAETPLALDPQTFLALLARLLSRIFMCYIYVCTHPSMPLVLIRIQVFDLLPGGKGRKPRAGPERTHITSHKPYFLAVPMNSPHVIHTPGNDIVSEVVLQTVEASLGSARSLVTLDTPKAQKPVRSLESMHILKGCSRFANCMGAWTPYADGEADISPLANFEQHSVNRLDMTRISNSPETSAHQLANIRFKGTADGRIVSERKFDHTKPVKRRRLEDSDGSDNNEVSNENSNDSSAAGSSKRPKQSQYASIAPIRLAEYEIQELWGPDEVSHVTLRLVGNDVFAGLHELAAGQNVADAATIPGWLTGEEGLSCGVVRGGRFSPE